MNNQKMDGITATLYAIGVFGALGFFIGLIDGVFQMAIPFGIVAAVCIGGGWYRMKKQKDEAEEKDRKEREKKYAKERKANMEKEIAEKEKLQKFISACGITENTDFSDDKKYWEVKKLADSYGMKYRDFDVFLSQCKEQCKKGGVQYSDSQKQYMDHKSMEETEDRIERVAKENQEYRRVIYCTGNDKAVEMYDILLRPDKERVDNIQQQIDDLPALARQQYNLYSNKGHHDSALLGGMAAGIAGGAFGAASYLQEEAKNAEIDEYNRNLGKKVFGDEQKKREELTQLRRKASFEYNQKASKKNKYRKRVVDRSIPKEDLFKELDFSLSKITVSKSGGVLFSTRIKGKNSIQIKGHPAVIDGVFTAIIKKDNKEICQLDLILPINGISYGESAFLEAAKQKVGKHKDANSYTYHIVPRNLWVVEKIE